MNNTGELMTVEEMYESFETTFTIEVYSFEDAIAQLRKYDHAYELSVSHSTFKTEDGDWKDFWTVTAKVRGSGNEVLVAGAANE